MALSPTGVLLPADARPASPCRRLPTNPLFPPPATVSPGGGGGGGSSRHTDPEYAALSELLEEMDSAPTQSNPSAMRNWGTNRRVPSAPDAVAARTLPPAENRGMQVAANGQRKRPRHSPPRGGASVDEAAQEAAGKAAAAQEAPSARSGQGGAAPPKHTRLADLEDHVRTLERENLHLKQALLLGKSGTAAVLASRAGHEGAKQLLAERTKVVTDMVEQLNATYLSLGDAARVWHKDCRIGVGVREWDARGRLETISLWNMIRSVFASIAVDIVELRPHLPDGEMMLTKWRIQGEIASPQQLEKVCASEDCPPTMRVALMAIKSSDLTFTVTTYVIFQELSIAEQHHCWDQVGVFKRLFGGEIPSAVVRILAVEDDGDEAANAAGDGADADGGRERQRAAR